MDTDETLIAGVIAGDPDAADQFVDRFSRFVWSILACDLHLDQDRAADLSQELFARLWEDGYRRLRNWRGDGAFVSYLGPIVRNLANELLRRDPRRREDPLDPQDGNPPYEVSDDQPSPEDLATLEEQRTALRRAVERLSPRDREIVRRRVELEQSHDEIAAALGMTANAVAVAWHRINERLIRLVRELEQPPRPPVSPPPRGRVRSTVPETSG